MKRKILFFASICLISLAFVFAGFLGLNKTKNSAFAEELPTGEFYTITFVSNEGTAVEPIQAASGETIVEPEMPTRDGYEFDGWFLDNETFLNEYEFSTMGNENISLFAKWNKLYSIYFETNGSAPMPAITATSGTPIEAPTSPKKEGNVFAGWYEDKNFSKLFSFTTMPDKNLTLYANWHTLSYTLSFVTNSTNSFPNQTLLYGTLLDIPTSLTKLNNKFMGWFLDAEFTEPLNFSVMPAKNTTIYAKWQEKIKINIVETKQHYELNDGNHDFRHFSNINGFVVQYNINGNWETIAPKDAGKYDVLITRNEDENYQNFTLLIKDGLEIKPIVLDYTWLISLLFIIAIIEIITAIIVKRMKIVKASKTLVIAPISLLLANKVLEINQIVLLAVSGSLALFGFVLLIYEIVSLHRTQLNYEFDSSSYDNRKNLKSVSDDEDDFVRLENNSKQNSDNLDITFSQDDIKEMLDDPSYFSRRDRAKKLIKKDSSSNDNQPFESKNSAINEEIIDNDKK